MRDMPKFLGYIVIFCLFYIIPLLIGLWMLPDDHIVWQWFIGYAVFGCILLISFKILIWLTPRKDNESIIHMHSKQDTKPRS